MKRPDALMPAAILGFETWVIAAATSVGALTGWRRWLAAFGAGAASMFALPPFFLWPILALTLPVLIWLMGPTAGGELDEEGARPDLDRSRLMRAASAGWLFGYGFHVAGLYWLREAFLITGGGLADLWPLGVLGLPAGLALFHALAAAAAVSVSRPGLSRVLALAIALGVTEWLRGNILTGFPWNVLGLALTYPSTLMQTTGLVGIYGLTSIAVLALGGPLATVAAAGRSSHRSKNQSYLIAAGVLVVPLALMQAYGVLRLSAPPPPMIEGVRLRLVQPAILQRDKWRADKQPEILQRHLDLSLRNARGEPDNLVGITHVIWPEAAMPFAPLQRPAVLAAIGETLPEGVHLLAGIVRFQRRAAAPADAPATNENIDAYNSLAVFDATGHPVTVYDKTHLVPFGEYLPLQGLLESIGLQALTRQRGGFSSGPTPRPLLDVGELGGIGPLICYEGIFPGTGRLSQQRPSVFINITNDGWFGNSTGPRQHLQQARMRSVEEGTSLVRVANNGISAVFDPYGRELARLDLDIAGVIDTGIPKSVPPPIYGRLGDWMFSALLAALCFAFLNTYRNRM